MKKTERLLLEQDLEVKLYDKRNKKSQKFLRLIVAKEKENSEVFYFFD
ncbi:hypothetical protein [Flavobacterium flavigenum]|nr:hypothetical protein [Flavobacterium flavigenum]